MEPPGRQKRRQRIVDSALQSRMILRFVGAILVSTVIFSGGFLVYYWVSYIAGDNLFKEYVIVYKQIEQIETVEIDGRTVERRSYRTEAQPETARWRMVLPALLLNNLLIAAVLSLLAIWYSHKFAGPLYRITSDIRRVISGSRGVRIRLRSKDEMRDLARQVNHLLDVVETSERKSEE